MPANYLLPVTGGYRRPCTVAASELTPVPGGGRHCASCQHLVQDYPQATIADVAQTQTALPNGQLCGWLNRPGPPVRFSRRLRWFVVALVLVVGWGLTARVALAQMRKPVPPKLTTPHEKQVSVARKQVPKEVKLYGNAQPPAKTGNEVYTYVEQMPELPEGGGLAGIMSYFFRHFHSTKLEAKGATGGSVHLEFIVTETGEVTNARIIRSGGSSIDAAALRVISSLPRFRPGRHNGVPVCVKLTLPISCIKIQ